MQGIGQTAMVVIASRRGVGRAITLATRLHPYEGIDVAVARARCWLYAKAGADDIAPVAPSLLACWLLAISSGVDDELRGKAVRCEHWRKSVDVPVLVTCRT